ncbi:hypothetical protein SAPIO_CDS6994 [Scedosporium apiospermum]|uniref:RanBD1 domain-containing protein n=1 Tax=Pseudallescheria apiosperma TaxID=563466 RepID=A0A084G0W2_PSEDA|nr:uncharacterized protein SAPIO_CDS6994 [Scedosporium apiospermum]KEZ40974.1 hypothetical protein SAPIO_CDS6994 [Scedosporium apiospermum]
MAPESRSPSLKASELLSDQPLKEDAETTAAREELRNTSISEADEVVRRPSTPDRNSVHLQTSPRDQISSPKKKRAHDQLEANEPSGTAEADVGGDNQDYPFEPDKKRHRDEQSPPGNIADAANDGHARGPLAGSKIPRAPENRVDVGNKIRAQANGPSASSSSAFANSGFSKLSSTTSPFGALGASFQGSSFGATAPKSSFASFGGSKPSLSFSQASNSSPFLTLASTSSNGAGASFKSPFSTGMSGKLTSFAGSGESLKQGGKARPFGAPDSDGDADDSGRTDDDSASDEDKSTKASPERDEAKAPVDEKRKLKLQRVAVDDGEAGEATVVQVRAKMYYIDNDNKDVGWKERGAGILKINVPATCVDMDEDGNPISGTFDASPLEEEDGGQPNSDAFKDERRER